MPIRVKLVSVHCSPHVFTKNYFESLNFFFVKSMSSPIKVVLKAFLNSLVFVKRVHKLPFVFNFWTLVNGNPHVGYLGPSTY